MTAVCYSPLRRRAWPGRSSLAAGGRGLRRGPARHKPTFVQVIPWSPKIVDGNRAYDD